MVAAGSFAADSSSGGGSGGSSSSSLRVEGCWTEPDAAPASPGISSSRRSAGSRGQPGRWGGCLCGLCGGLSLPAAGLSPAGGVTRKEWGQGWLEGHRARQDLWARSGAPGVLPLTLALT